MLSVYFLFTILPLTFAFFFHDGNKQQQNHTLTHPDGSINNTARIQNNHYRQKQTELPEPVVFLPVSSSTSGRIKEEFLCLLFLHDHRDAN